MLMKLFRHKQLQTLERSHLIALMELEIKSKIPPLGREKPASNDVFLPVLFKLGSIRAFTSFFCDIWNKRRIRISQGDSLTAPIFRSGIHNTCGNHHELNLIPIFDLPHPSPVRFCLFTSSINFQQGGLGQQRTAK